MRDVAILQRRLRPRHGCEVAVEPVTPPGRGVGCVRQPVLGVPQVLQEEWALREAAVVLPRGERPWESMKTSEIR